MTHFTHALFFVVGLIMTTSAFAETNKTDFQQIEYGDDKSEFANDGECDDVRFFGTTMAEDFMFEDVGHDATDCKNGFKKKTLKYKEIFIKFSNTEPNANEIDFGDNKSDYPNDDECDDPRFVGQGMADDLFLEDIGHDANDCKKNYMEKVISVRTEFLPYNN